MDTQDGTSEEGTEQDTPSTEKAEETTTSDTSEVGTQESADKKRLADKDRYIKQLEKEKKELAERQATSTDPDDVTDWKILHSEEIKACGETYLEEVKFFKEQGVTLTPKVLEKALNSAKHEKGLTKQRNDAGVTPTPDQGEERPTKPANKSSEPVPDWAIRSGWTQEKWDERVQKTKAEKGGK